MSKKAFENLTETMFYVLMALSGGEKCGTEIAGHIEGLTGSRVRLGPGTLYTILSKFEDKKLIRETMVEGRKRTYVLTQKGAEIYRDELERLRRCVQDAEGETSTL